MSEELERLYVENDQLRIELAAAIKLAEKRMAIIEEQAEQLAVLRRSQRLDVSSPTRMQGLLANAVAKEGEL